MTLQQVLRQAVPHTAHAVKVRLGQVRSHWRNLSAARRRYAAALGLLLALLLASAGLGGLRSAPVMAPARQDALAEAPATPPAPTAQPTLPLEVGALAPPAEQPPPASPAGGIAPLPDAESDDALSEGVVEDAITHAAAAPTMPEGGAPPPSDPLEPAPEAPQAIAPAPAETLGAAAGGASPLSWSSPSRSPLQLQRDAPAQPPALPATAPGLPADLAQDAAATPPLAGAPLRPESQRWASAAGAAPSLSLYRARDASASPVLPDDRGAPLAAPALNPRVAILIDDIGWDLATLRRFLALDADLSYAVLPQLEKSREAALTIAAAGHEVLLHLPMEPHEYPDQDPGRGALLLAMQREELRANFLSALRSVPMRVGVNNHMGSRFTENEERMRYVLSLVKAEGLFFVDSLTTPRSVALQEARQIGLRAMARHVFLDHEVGHEGTLAQLERLIRIAERHGSALGIGHPHPTTLRALQESLPTLRRRGVRLVPVSSLLD